MRTTFFMLQSLVEWLRDDTGINYIARSSDTGKGYIVCIQDKATGAEQDPVVSGSPGECYTAVRTMRQILRDVQYKRPSVFPKIQPDTTGPQFIAVISDGILQSVISLTGKDIHYLLIDEDEIEAADETEGTSDEMSKNDILKAGVTEGLETGAFGLMSDCIIPDIKPETVCRVLGYDLNYNAFNLPSSPAQ